MKFFESFWKASFYKGGKATSFWGAFGKITLVSFLLSVVTAVCVYVSFGMHLPSYIYSYGVQALNGYPSELVVTINGDALTKNTEGELHLYPIPDGIVGGSKFEELLPGYIFTVNDKVSASLETYRQSNSLILLAKDGIVVEGNDRQIQIISYKDVLQNQDTFEITKATILDMVAAVNVYAPYTPHLVSLVIIVLISLFAPLGYLFFTIFIGLVVMWLSQQLLHKKLNYKESYIHSLYALAPVVVVTEILQYIPYVRVVANHIPLLELLLVLAFLWFMFKDVKVQAKKEKVESKVTKAPTVKKAIAKKETKKKIKAV